MKHLSDLPPQLKRYRSKLNLSQKDMLLSIGMSQQQYQRIENGNDARLSTIFRVLEGLNLELMLIPKEHIEEVTELISQDKLEQSPPKAEFEITHSKNIKNEPNSSWENILSSLEDKETDK